MLWYKSWLETRWRFLIGLAVVMCSAAGIVLIWPRMLELVPLASSMEVSGELGRRLRESVELSREYRGYIWSQWFRQNGTNLGTLFAVLLGTGGMFSQRSGGLFTLSLPVSRNRLLATRAAAGLAELWALAFLPALLISLLSPSVGKNYGLGDALIQSACLFLGAAAFFSLAFLLSTVFSDLWRPLLLALVAALVLAMGEQIFRELAPYGIFRVMNAETYFRTGKLPWPGLLASAAASAAMLYGAGVRTAREDF
jgi:hypothetical protein